MSTNKDLASRLAAMRVKAKEAATAEPAAVKEEPAPNLPTTPRDSVKIKSPSPQLKVLSSRKAVAPKQGRGGAKVRAQESSATSTLERTTITLKGSDTDALSELQSFLMNRLRKKPSSTSTLIRLALSYAKQAIPKDSDALAKTYQQILDEDGRRKTVNV
jgi:hypothetical protein